MKVILNDHIENLGERGDSVAVKPGYANNYLLPKGLALEATAMAARLSTPMPTSGSNARSPRPASTRGSVIPSTWPSFSLCLGFYCSGPRYPRS